jgi:hypothetical protein
VPWQRIDPRHLRQRNPEGLTVAYADTGGRDVGHLHLDLDINGRVATFQLS